MGILSLLAFIDEYVRLYWDFKKMLNGHNPLTGYGQPKEFYTLILWSIKTKPSTQGKEHNT